MYKALNYWVFGGFDGVKTPFEFIDFAAENSLDGIELTVGDALKIDITEAECREIAAYAKSKKVGLRTLATGNYGVSSLSAADENERRQAIEFTKKYLYIASWLGAETILVVPGSTSVAWDPSRPVVPYDIAWKQSTASLNELLPLAEKLNINIALENVWMRFLLSPMEWKFFLDQFSSEKIGMYLDVGNCLIYCDGCDYINLLGKRVKAIHIKNFKGSGGLGDLSGFGDDLFVGDADYKRIFAACDKIGYKGTFTVEMIPFDRLPNLVLPDQALAEKMAKEIKEL